MLFLLMLIQPAPLQAAPQNEPAAYDPDYLETLFKTYQRKQAYDYALKHLPTMEGDPYFDYFYGVSAIDTGHASEGVFALERVLLVFPNDQVARLELARGYYILQDYALSRQAFETVLETSPPSQVRETAEAYLDKIRVSESRYRPTHSGYAKLTLGNDDNVNAGVDEDVDLGFLAIISPDSLSQDDNFTTLAGGWTYAYPFSPGWYFESTLSGEMRKNIDLDQFDTLTAGLQLGIVHLTGDHRLKAELGNQQFNLDGDSYRKLNSLSLGWKYSLSEKSYIDSTLQYATLDYPDFPNRNSDLVTLGASFVHSFSSYLQPMIFLTASLGQETPEIDNVVTRSDTERDITAFRGGVILSFSNTLALQAAAGLQSSEYAGPLVFPAGLVREDDYTTADLALLWVFKRKWRLDTRFSHSENDSTFNLRDYQRNTFDVSLNYSF